MTSFMVYVDESGDEGFQFSSGIPGQGSSHWFILSAVAIRSANDHLLRKAVANVRLALNRPNDHPLHFRKLPHIQRLVYVRELAQVQIRTVTVLIHKPSIKEPETFREKNRLYFYGVRLLLERISWLCRDAHQGQKNSAGDGSAKVMFSNRSSTNYQELREYVKLVIGEGDPLEVRIDSSVIKPDKMFSIEHARLDGLQAADAVASSFYFAAQDHLKITEPRYVHELSKVVYTVEKEGFGYGVKFWPKESYQLIEEMPNLKWAKGLFGKK
jgi:hypothetical protein